jgi:hypothetical protein
VAFCLDAQPTVSKPDTMLPSLARRVPLAESDPKRQLLVAKMAANDSSAVASERTIITGEIGYYASYFTIGYTTGADIVMESITLIDRVR